MSNTPTAATLTSTQRMLEAIGAGSHMIERAASYTEYDDPRPYDVQDGIAIIDISGPISASQSWRACSYQEITSQVQQAAADKGVTGIILRVNSPGGETDRAFESAALVEEAGKKKPTWCVADVNAYSAGYLLACAADRIYAAPISGGLGSIGVYAMHVDHSEALDKAGINVTLVSAGEGKTDGNPWEPLSPAARKDIKANVDRLYGEFVGYVARRRNMTEEGIRTMGAALKRGAADAIESGLADRAGSLETAIAEMAAYIRAKQFSTSVAASASTHPQMKGGHMAQLTEADTAQATAALQLPGISPEALTTARAAGFSEAEEIVALCAIANMDTRAALGYLKARKPVAEVRDTILAAQVAKSGAETTSRTMPDTAAESANNDTKAGHADSALLAASERMFGKKEGK